MPVREHDIEPIDDHDQTVYRCTNCGRVQTSEDAIKLFRCVSTNDLPTADDGPPSNEADIEE